MRARLVIGLIVALVLSTAVLGRIALVQWRNASALQTYATSLENANKALRGRLLAMPDELARQRKARQEADRALEQDPDWSRGAVPGPVSDGLCKRLRCR